MGNVLCLRKTEKTSGKTPFGSTRRKTKEDRSPLYLRRCGAGERTGTSLYTPVFDGRSEIHRRVLGLLSSAIVIKATSLKIFYNVS